MEVYIVCFALTLACAWINEKLLNKNINNSLTWISAALVILIPAILAGCRDYHIGTDIYVYAKATFTKILQLGWQGLFIKQDNLLSVIEPGFKFLAYITSLFSSSPNAFLFSIALVIGSAIYFALYNMRESCSIFMGEFVFLFACYNETYNMMRQCLAMAFILLAISFFFNKKYWLVAINILVAISFHFTAILAIPMLLLMFYMEIPIERLGNDFQNRWKKLAVLAGVLILLLFAFKPFFVTMLEAGMLPVKYGHYVTSDKGIGIKATEFIRYSLPYLFLLFQHKKIKYANAFMAMALCDMLMYPLRSQEVWLYRISTYFFYIRIISFAEMRVNFNGILNKRTVSFDDLIKICMMILIVYLWFYYSILNNQNETYPYTSTILDIYL